MKVKRNMLVSAIGALLLVAGISLSSWWSSLFYIAVRHVAIWDVVRNLLILMAVAGGVVIAAGLTKK